MKKSVRLISYFCIGLIFYANSFAFPGKDLKKDGVHFALMGLKLFTAPNNFEKSDWRKFGTIAITTGSLFALDAHIQKIFLRNQNSNNDQIFKIDKVYGNKNTFLTSFGLYGIGSIFKQPTIKRLGLNSSEAIVYSAFLSSLLKFLFGRHRPETNDGHLAFTPFQLKDTYQSLPSGHATVSMAFSTAMAKSIENFWWKTFWYGSGGLVALARIYHDRHWASDVFLGAALGYFMADFVVKNSSHEKLLNNSKLIIFSRGQKIGLSIAF